MLTVRELLRDLDVELRSGKDRLDEAVRWVHISELRDPTPWLSGGEVLLTTGLQLDTAERQRTFVTCLAEHGLAGLGVGTGFAHDTVPEPMVAVGTALGFPIFEIPYEVPFIAITEAAFSRLVNEQYAVLRRSIAAHERLERIVLSEAGLDAVVESLAGLISGGVAVFDQRGQLLVHAEGAGALAREAVGALGAEVHERAGRGERRSYAPNVAELSGRALALPVGATGTPEGRTGSEGPVAQAWLVAVKRSGGLTELDRLTLHHAVTIVALELLRGRVAEDTERRLAGDILSAVLSGDLDGAELARRLEPFGLADRVGALVVGGLPPGRSGLVAGERALATALRDEAVGGLVASAGGSACALLPGLPEDELFALAERVCARSSRELGASLSAGAGRPVPGGEARRTFHEARCALEARALGAPAHQNGNGVAGHSAGVATYRDLGSFQLLLSLQENDALRLFCDSVLGPIEEGEGAYGGELMRSLEAFIEENGQWERAARRLYCHRHTLRYRMKRVEQLTGRSLGTARDRIEFWLALRGRELAR